MHPNHRSFGFNFNDSFLQGTYFVAGERINAHLFYKNEEFTSLQEFAQKNNLIQEQFNALLERITKIIQN